MNRNLPVILLILLFSMFTKVYSQSLSGDDLEVRLFIIGQGDPVYSLWGHTGIAIKNLNNDLDVFYDFGNFYFEDDDFFKNFAIGRWFCIAWAAYTEPYKQSVLNEERDLTEYVLSLPAEKKLEMYQALKTKALPENRTYLYHHYNDNCSTRIRDYIDIAVSGQLQRSTDFSRGSTFRKSFLLYTSNKKITGSTLSLLQGPNIDNEITIWQEMFLPDILEEVITDFNYTNERGEQVSLVKKINKLYVADQRKLLPETYKSPYIAAIIISTILSAFILFLNIRNQHGKKSYFTFMNILFSFILGTLGTVLLFLTSFTDHTYSYNNLNLFMINPISLFVIPASIMYFKKGLKWKKRLDILWTVQVISTLLMIAIKILTPVKQDNLLEIILVLPVLVAFSPIIPTSMKNLKLLR